MGRMTLEANAEPLLNAIAELAALLEKPLDIPREIVDQLLGISRDFSTAVEIDSATTARAVVMTLKPSKLLLDLVAAVRALD
jgi:hypothetical protein